MKLSEITAQGGTVTSVQRPASTTVPTKPKVLKISELGDKVQKPEGVFSKVAKYAGSVAERTGEEFAKTGGAFMESAKKATDTSLPYADRQLEAFRTVKEGTVGVASSAVNAALIPVGDALGKLVEFSSDKLSDIPFVQRVAASDAAERILDSVDDLGVSLGDAAKKDPRIAKDVNDLINVVLLATGPKTVAPVKRAAGGVPGDTSKAIPNWLSTAKNMYEAKAANPTVFADRNPADNFISNVVAQLESNKAPKTLVNAIKGIDVSKADTFESLKSLVDAAVTRATGSASPIALGVIGGAKSALRASEKVGATLSERMAARAAALVERRAAKGIFEPKTAATFEKYGITPPVSAVSSRRSVQAMEARAQSFWGGEKIGKIVEEAQKKVGNIAESLKKYADPDALRRPSVTMESVGVELKGALETARKTFNKAKSDIYDEADRLIGNNAADFTRTRETLEAIIREKGVSLAPDARAQVKYFQQLLNSTRTAQKRTYRNIKQTRTDIGTKLRNRSDPVSTGDKASFERVYAALSDDLESTIMKSGTQAAEAMARANQFYKEGIGRLNSTVGKTIKNARYPERVFGSLVRPGDVNAVKQLRELVGAESFQVVGDAFMNTVISSIIDLTGRINVKKLAGLLSKYGDAQIRELVGERGLKQLKDLLRSSIADDIVEASTVEGRVLPGRLLRAVEKYDDATLKRVFTPDELTKLEDVVTMAKALDRNKKLVAGSPTAEKLATDFNVGALGLGIFTGAGLAPLVMKLGVEYGITKLFTTKWGRNLMTSGGFRKAQKAAARASKTAPVVSESVQAAKAPGIADLPPNQGPQVARYSEDVVPVEKPAVPAPEVAPVKSMEAPKAPTEMLGVAGGIQADDEGNISINPIGAALGVVGAKFSSKFGPAQTKAIKSFFKRQPPFGLLKDMEAFIDYARLKKVPEGYKSGVDFEADVRDAVSKWGLDADKSNKALADQFDEILAVANKAPTTNKLVKPKVKEVPIINPETRRLNDPAEGMVFFHGTTKDNKASILKNGIDTSKNSKGRAEQPNAFYVGDESEARMYGRGEALVGVRVKPGEKIKTLSVTSPEWREVVGNSTSAKETSEALDELRKRGYDAVNYGDEIEILSYKKFEVFDPVNKEAMGK